MQPKSVRDQRSEEFRSQSGAEQCQLQAAAGSADRGALRAQWLAPALTLIAPLSAEVSFAATEIPSPPGSADSVVRSVTADDFADQISAAAVVPDLQLAMLREAAALNLKLPDRVFATLSSEQAQLECVNLLRLDSYAWIQRCIETGFSTASLRKELCDAALSPQIRELILRRDCEWDPAVQRRSVAANSGIPVVVLEQAHTAPGLSRADVERVGRYQSLIFEDLRSRYAALKPGESLALFLEDLTEDIEPGDPNRISKILSYVRIGGVQDLEAGQIADLFASGATPSSGAESYSAEQLSIIGAMGGGALFAFLHPDVKVFATSTMTEWEEKIDITMDLLAGKGASESCYKAVEGRVLERIGKAVAADKALRPVLVYGLGHRFNEVDLAASAVPLELSITAWPAALNALFWSLEAIKAGES